MCYPCSENKGVDQLRGYREANLRLCFRICRLLVFRCGGLFSIIKFFSFFIIHLAKSLAYFNFKVLNRIIVQNILKGYYDLSLFTFCVFIIEPMLKLRVRLWPCKTS